MVCLSEGQATRYLHQRSHGKGVLQVRKPFFNSNADAGHDFIFFERWNYRSDANFAFLFPIALLNINRNKMRRWNYLLLPTLELSWFHRRLLAAFFVVRQKLPITKNPPSAPSKWMTPGRSKQIRPAYGWSPTNTTYGNSRIRAHNTDDFDKIIYLEVPIQGLVP